jgi:hypothetical protein
VDLSKQPVRAVPKPPKKIKTRSKIAGGGRKPKEAGRRKEREFANQYGFTRVVGSGAFGPADPLLGGDIRGEIGRKKFLLEMKSHAIIDATGAKTVRIPLAVLDKIRKESEVLERYGMVVFHPKGTNRYIVIADWEDFYSILTEQEQYIKILEDSINGRYTEVEKLN